ncbi:MAG: AsmA family protein, partial [Planctomycetota bacterium]
MSKLSNGIETVRKFLPRRRRRFWRYVSPRRHGVGVMVLALLTVSVYGYWYQTNDRRIRRKTEHYLRDLTGGRVKIRKASFSFFGGIELDGVRVYVPGEPGSDPVFEAHKVIMRHRPWGLLVAGQLKPIEIVCIEPVVRLEYDVQSGSYRIWELLALARQREWASNLKISLPPLRVRDGRLVVVDVDGELSEKVGEIPIDAALVPRAPDRYAITFEETCPSDKKGMQGVLLVDLTAGRVIRASGILPLENLEKTLPRRFRHWRSRYALSGKVRLERIAERPDEEETLLAELIDVSMKLPQDQGALELLHVTGKLVFDTKGVTLEGVTGRIRQADNARVEVSGRYDGYDTDAPYSVTLNIQEMTVPQSSDVSGFLSDALAKVHQIYDPHGRMNVSLTLQRDGAGKTAYAGLAEPQGMSILFKHFPYRIDGVRGKIAFTPEKVELQNLHAERADAKFIISGEATNFKGPLLHDITVEVANMPFDAELRRAIPNNFLRVWEALSPVGRSAATVHAVRR